MTLGSLSVETIENVVPLDRQFGISPKKTVPDVLREALFGQPTGAMDTELATAGGDPAASAQWHTYAILDAAKVANLPELLSESGLEHRCLFKGSAYEELKDVAPWIVRLEVGNDLTRRLFTGPEGINGLWDTEPGIYVRSQSTLEDMFKHFRKFTRVQDENGKWYYFRCWESGSLGWLAMHGPWELLNCLAKPGLVREIFAFSEDFHVRIMQPNSQGKHISASSLFVLDPMIWASLGRFAEKRFSRRLRTACLRISDGAERRVDAVLKNLSVEGFRARSVLWNLACWWSTDEGAETMEQHWVKTELAASKGLPDAIRRDRLRNLCIEKMPQVGIAEKWLVEEER